MALIDGLKNIGDAIREKNGTTELIPFKDMPQAIKDISGGGTSYTDIVFNEDNTITLTDTEGTEHTMACEYEDGKLVSISYDEKEIPLTYDGEDLKKIGGTDINLSALFILKSDSVYTHYGISKDEYPYLSIQYMSANKCVYVCFSQSVTITSSKITYTDCLRGVFGSYTFTDFENIGGAIQYALDNVGVDKLKTTTSCEPTNDPAWTQYINFDVGAFTGTIYAI